MVGFVLDVCLKAILPRFGGGESFCCHVSPGFDTRSWGSVPTVLRGLHRMLDAVLRLVSVKLIPTVRACFRSSSETIEGRGRDDPAHKSRLPEGAKQPPARFLQPYRGEESYIRDPNNDAPTQLPGCPWARRECSMRCSYFHWERPREKNRQPSLSLKVPSLIMFSGVDVIIVATATRVAQQCLCDLPLGTFFSGIDNRWLRPAAANDHLRW